jgi:hypothetical protein
MLFQTQRHRLKDDDILIFRRYLQLKDNTTISETTSPILRECHRLEDNDIDLRTAPPP